MRIKYKGVLALMWVTGFSEPMDVGTGELERSVNASNVREEAKQFGPEEIGEALLLTKKCHPSARVEEFLKFTDLQVNDAVCLDHFPTKPFIVRELNQHERIVVLREARGQASRPFSAEEFEEARYVKFQ